MNLENRVLNIMKKGPPTRFTIPIINIALKHARTRKALFNAIEKAMGKMSFDEQGPSRPEKLREDRHYMSRALLTSLECSFASGSISPQSIKKLTDVIKSPLFSAIRKWHSSYWLDQSKENCGNLLAPCIIRDNSDVFYKIVKAVETSHIDEGAKTYLSFIEQGHMPQYNMKYRELTDPIWKQEYLQKK